MRVWITSFLLLFGMAELYQWAKHFTVPLPVFILGGAFLAIASNYERRSGFPFQQSNDQLADMNGQKGSSGIPSLGRPLGLSESEQANQSSGNTNTKLAKPVSFTIRRSTQQRIED